MAVTIDPRPTYFGDRMIVTGSYTAAASITIELGSILNSIDGVILNPAAVTPHSISITDNNDDADTIAGVAVADVATFSGTTIIVHKAAGAAGNTADGTFVVIGRR